MLDQDNYKIPLQPERPVAEDYAQLKSLGIGYIQTLSQRVWTDFNAHDPGVTTLELLCYALTDLGYRTNFPIEDILTGKDKRNPSLKDSFFTAAEILKQHPLTVLDYRMLVLDYFPEIKNVWLMPVQEAIPDYIYLAKKKDKLTLDIANAWNNDALVIHGLYNVKIEVAEPAREQALIGELYDFLMDHRNLCENFNCIRAIEHEYVGMCLDLDFDGTTDPLVVKKAIYKAMYEYCAPSVKRYTLQQMYDKGKTTEEIFSAYQPKHGFLDREELAHFEKRKVLYTSDVINLLMDVKGVENVRSIHFNSYRKHNGVLDTADPLVENAAYCLHLQNSDNAFQFFIDTETEKANKISFYYQDLQVYLPGLVASEDVVTDYQPVVPFVNDLPLPSGRYRELDKYYSIQNEFPNNYYIGQQGIAVDATDERKAQRLQFKGYLLHFEQLMTDYLAQLNQVRNLLSWKSDPDYRNYAYQSLSAAEISDLEQLKTGEYDALFDNNSSNANYYQDVLGIDAQQNFDRRNRFLNHLIARFNDSFSEFSIVQFFKLTQHSYHKASIIADKKSFLRTYPRISADRLKAANYKKAVWNTPNLSGYEMRVAKKLGLTNVVTSNPDLVVVHSLVHPVISDAIEVTDPVSLYDYSLLPFDQQFGFHIVEHVLLKPATGAQLLHICDDDDDDIHCSCKDPYSFRISVVLPGWLPIAIDASFRKYVEKVLREELPAHIAAKICWISPVQMLAFEKAYFGWMNELQHFKENCGWNPGLTQDKLTALVTVINDLKNIYPPSHLADCTDIVYDRKTNSILRYPAVLGKVALSKDLTFDINWVTPPENIWDSVTDDTYVPLFIKQKTDGTIASLKMQEELPLKGQPFKIMLSKSKAGFQGLILPGNNQLKGIFLADTDTKTGQLLCCVRLIDEKKANPDELIIQLQPMSGKYTATLYLNKKLRYDIDFSVTEKTTAIPAAPFYIEWQEPFKKTLILVPGKVKKSVIYSQPALEHYYLSRVNMRDPGTFKLPVLPDDETNWIDHFLKQM